jgi:hypothetical protein
MADLPGFFTPVHLHDNSTVYSRPYPYWDVEICSIKKLKELSDRMKTSDKAGTDWNNALIYLIFMLCLTFASQVFFVIFEPSGIASH